MSDIATPSRAAAWRARWAPALSGALYGAVLGLAVWAIITAADRDSVARRLAKAGTAYCAASDADRAAIVRRLHYRLPAGVELEIRCSR
jgi:hypothetical protein